MAASVAQAARAQGLTPESIDLVSRAYALAMNPRVAALENEHHPAYLHPGRSVLVLLLDVGRYLGRSSLPRRSTTQRTITSASSQVMESPTTPAWFSQAVGYGAIAICLIGVGLITFFVIGDRFSEALLVTTGALCLLVMGLMDMLAELIRSTRRVGAALEKQRTQQGSDAERPE